MIKTYFKENIFAIITYIFTLIVLLFTIVLTKYLNIPFSDLSRDPTAIIEARPYLGFLSNLGVVFWSFATAICLFTYSILFKKREVSFKNNFILWGGLISFVLLFDDLYQFHEKLFPKIFHLDEKLLFTFYGLFLLFYLIKFRILILESNYIILLVSLGFFSVSIFVDIFFPETDTKFYEDAPKFIGIVSWFCFHYLTCKKLLLKNLQE